jgi:Protein of unknown function (DUF3572)
MKKALPREAAEHIAIAALNYLASDAEHLGGFLAATGLGPQNLRESAREPEFLAAVLRYIMQDEALLLAFADKASVSPETVVHADLVLNPPADGLFG